MDNRLLGLVILAVWGATVMAFFYAHVRRIGYLSALSTCLIWAAVIAGFMLFNYWLADQLALSRSTSGYVRGKQLISTYGFLVQLLLIVEIALAVGIKSAIQRRTTSHQRDLRERPTYVRPAQAAVKRPEPKSEPNTYQEERAFTPNLSCVFFLCCALGNFWLAEKALQRSFYGLFFVVVGFGLLVAAYKASFVSRSRRE